MSSIAIRRRQRGNIRLLPLLALLVTFGSGVLLYRHFFHRSGEQATQLIPADAVAVATLDLSPQPDQVPLFTRIAKAMVDEKIADPLEKALTASMNGSSFFAEIQPQLEKSYAAAMWTKASVKLPLNSLNDTTYVLLATVREPSQVAVIAAKHGVKAEQDGLTYYQINNEKFCVSVIQGYMLVADSPATLMRIQSVAQGKTPSLSSLASFQEARGRLPAEANLMMFTHMTEAVKAMQQGLTISQNSIWSTKVNEWAVGAVTVRDLGIETIFKYPYDEKDPGAKAMSQIAPIDPGLYKRLPANAYGFMIFSQLGRVYEAVDSSLKPGTDERKTFEDGINGFEKGSGLSITKDLVPGLSGDLVLGVYPAPDKKSIPDGLIVLDDANGADPATMVEKIKAVIIKLCKDNHSTPPAFKSTTRDGATIWTLDDATQKGLLESSGMATPPESSASASPFNPGNSTSTKEKALPAKTKTSKQLIFATVGKTVLIASSEDMLDRAIASYNSGSELMAGDPGYTAALKQIPQGTQNLLLVDLPGVMESMRSTFQSMYPPSSKVNVDDVVGYFGARGNALVATQGYDGKMMSARLFFPLDYTKIIHVIGATNGASNQNSGAGSTSIGTKVNQDSH